MRPKILWRTGLNRPKLKRALPIRQSSFTRTLYENEKINLLTNAIKYTTENEKITFLLLQSKSTSLPLSVKIIVVNAIDFEVSTVNFDV